MNFRKIILPALVVVASLILIFFWLKPPPPPPIKLPNPNGYDDLVKAGQMFIGDLPDCFWENLNDAGCLEKSRAYLAANSEALKLIRVGLSRESRIPIVYSHAYFSQHLSELALMKRLAQTLNAEGRVAENENRLDDAIQSYVDTALIHEKMRGGVMIDELVGMAVEGIGVGSLRKIADQLNTSQRKALIEKLARLHANRESYDEIMANEGRFVSVYRLRDRLAHIAAYFSLRKVTQKFQNKIKYAQARLGLFLVDLSLRNFESENKRSPKTLQELVPKYLPFLPKDDFSGNDFVYRPQTNGYLLYGVGPDGKDDGGTPFVSKGIESPGDMLNDSHY